MTITIINKAYNNILALADYALKSDLAVKADIATVNTQLAGKADVASLNNKADRNLSNCTVPYITQTYINGQTGYIRLSEGTLIQWGTVGYPGGAYVTFDVYFPTLFSNNVYSPVLTARGTDNINAAAMKLLNVYNNHMQVKYTGAGNNSGTINGLTWIAIGR